MKKLIIILALSIGASISINHSCQGQIALDTLQQIQDYEHLICSLIPDADINLKPVKLCAPSKSVGHLFRRNDNNCKKESHDISEEAFTTAFNHKFSKPQFHKLSRAARKDSLRAIILAESKPYKYAIELMDLLYLRDGRHSKDLIRQGLEHLNDYRSVRFLLEAFDHYLTEREQLRLTAHCINTDYILGLYENRKLITDHLEFLIDRDYINYSQATSHQHFIKGSSFYHDNDVFVPFLNEDKYYTGGGRYEIFTDYLRFNILHNLFNRDFGALTYQGLFFGVEAYTPYIRFFGVDSLERAERYANDRPFASYEYLGLSQYSLCYTGKWRSKVQFRVGLVGGARSETVQSVLHRDQLIKSVKVIGWENQIANGGRYGFNIDYRRERMLFEDKKDAFDQVIKYRTVYPTAFVEAQVGHFNTSLGIGLGISNLSLKERDGNDNFRLLNGKKQRCHFFGNISARYVVHNSSLEGFGVFKTPIPDPTEEIPSDNYTISKDNTIRLVGQLQGGMAVRTNRMTLFGRITLHTKEFKALHAQSIYGWGTVGVSFTDLSRR